MVSSLLVGSMILSCMDTASSLPIQSSNYFQRGEGVAGPLPARQRDVGPMNLVLPPEGCRSHEPGPAACPEGLGSGSGTSRDIAAGLVQGVCVATSLSGASRWDGECRVGAH